MQKGKRLLSILTAIALSSGLRGADIAQPEFEEQFERIVRPFFESYCITCHGGDKPEAGMDLSAYGSMTALLQDGPRWDLVVDYIESEEMPPLEAELFPAAGERREAVNWFHAVRAYETQHNAGDPGIVLARRLSNAEYDYTIRDLTNVDIRPTREFPVDPANTAGFDNSGETLVMSPTLLNKYLNAAREVASHLYLKEDGFAFAPHPMLVETDRDKFYIQQIIDFYHQQNIDYADYFEAAWIYRYRVALGQPDLTLVECARERNLSPKYLATIWAILEDGKEGVGPVRTLRSMWQVLQGPSARLDDMMRKMARTGCEAMRDYVIDVRQKVELRFLNINAGEGGTEWLPFLHWKNVQYATHRRSYDRAQLQVEGEPPLEPEGPVRTEGGNQFGPGQTPLVENVPGDPDLVVPAGQRAPYEAAFARFCSVFPDMFYMEQRGRNYFRIGRDEGRYLSAGYHNVLGFFRDDQALYELLLDEAQQAKLDRMWRELDFVAAANIRSYVQFAVNGTRGARESFNDNEPALTRIEQLSNQEIASTPMIEQLKAGYLARITNGDEVAINAIKDYFREVDEGIRWVEQARLMAEPSHLAGLVAFATQAFRRPLSVEARDDLLSFYRMARTELGLSHEEAIRESVVLVLMSPEFNYRVDLVEAGEGIHPLSDYDLASRLSYFLWSSLPDEELLSHAAAGDLHQPGVIAAQARRMLKDSRARALAVEWGGNWLDFRHFEAIATVDRERFPEFTDELRHAMFEEPVRFLLDVMQHDRPVLDLLYANDTFVNSTLAEHYGVDAPTSDPDTWVRVEITEDSESDRRRSRGRTRGGLLPMAAFLTKNAPGLRTSPVKRGYWVVKNVLGERIPPPPPSVPVIPTDETKLELPLSEMLARHRADRSCAPCHDRFDALGLVFEGYGPVGEIRRQDLAGRRVSARATFPDGSQGEGLEGVLHYIRENRQDDFIDNLCGKLLAYALGRSLILSDQGLIDEMHRRLVESDHRFDALIETIVTSPKFLTKRSGGSVATNGG